MEREEERDSYPLPPQRGLLLPQPGLKVWCIHVTVPLMDLSFPSARRLYGLLVVVLGRVLHAPQDPCVGLPKISAALPHLLRQPQYQFHFLAMLGTDMQKA